MKLTFANILINFKNYFENHDTLFYLETLEDKSVSSGEAQNRMAADLAVQQLKGKWKTSNEEPLQ